MLIKVCFITKYLSWCRLLIKKKIKRKINIYLKENWWVVFYGISTLIGYLMTNPVHTNALNIYDLLINSLCVTLL